MLNLRLEYRNSAVENRTNTITLALADLAVVNFTAPATVTTAAELSVSYVVENRGTSDTTEQ